VAGGGPYAVGAARDRQGPETHDNVAGEQVVVQVILT